MNTSETLPESPLTPNLNRWNKDAEARAWLGRTLADPFCIQLLGVLQEMGTPRSLEPDALLGEEGDSRLTRMAMSMAHLNGYHTCLQNLRVLSEPARPLHPLEHGGWKGSALKKRLTEAEIPKPVK